MDGQYLTADETARGSEAALDFVPLAIAGAMWIPLAIESSNYL
jgi:hypothetical protein